MTNDLRLIEDYLPIEAISKEASREKSVRKGHISTLHLWWARRPLVACRAAVYGALVPADRWVKDVEIKNPPADQSTVLAMKNGTKRGLNRKAAKDFVTKLCRYPKTDPTSPADIKIKNETEAAIVEAQKHILHAHADRLTAELAEAKNSDKPPAWVAEFNFKGEKVTYDDIIAGLAPRPRVLDMFAGGGAIPLEALRLGCEAYAVDLNPVAHIIQLCTLVYPQKFGKPDPDVRGMTGPKNAKGETTWGGLADEVGHWGNWVLERARKEIGDLYPPILDPQASTDAPPATLQETMGFGPNTKPSNNVNRGFLAPVAYLWTRTVRCKNPACDATVPLVKQTWLCKKEGRYVAMRMIAPKGEKKVRFEVVEAQNELDLGFDPEGFSKGGNATCPFCGTVAESDYVKEQGINKAIREQLMSVICTRRGTEGKVYLQADHGTNLEMPEDAEIEKRIAALKDKADLALPDEQIIDDGKNSFWCTLYGYTRWSHIFTMRQNLALLTFCKGTRDCGEAITANKYTAEHKKAVLAYLGLAVSRTANFNSSLCLWNYTGGRGVVHSFSHYAVPLAWDFPESNPFNEDAAGWRASLNAVHEVVRNLPDGLPSNVFRGNAKLAEVGKAEFDAIIIDPPYYDNISYANLADFFFVWLKRAIGQVFPEHFSAGGSPKKAEIVSDTARHNGKKTDARRWFEENLSASFTRANQLLRPSGSFVCVYAHKTTLGWATLVNALRQSGFVVAEAWPLSTERPGGMKVGRAMLASSIFLVARKRAAGVGRGGYENEVQPDLDEIIRERVDTLWEMGIVGADLVIACVGAGLRAFTKYDRVEYANGEEVPAEKFLVEVEGVVLDAMMGKLLGASGGNVSSIDSASRFYVLWRFVYKTAEIDAGEAIVFTYSQHVELDGSQALSGDANALVEKKKAKYRTRDFTERGQNEKLGLPTAAGQPAPLVDQLHRILWLMENSPRKLGEFIDEAKPDRERLRVLAQALAGAALSGKSDADAGKLVSTTTAEQSALGKLLANWRNLVENRMVAEEETLFGKQNT